MKRVIQILVVLTATAGFACLAPTSAGAKTPAEADAVPARCVTVLGAPDAVTRIAQIASHTCYRGPDSLARQESAMDSQTLAGSFLLISFYDAQDFGGGSDQVYGSQPCDIYGYGISNMDTIHYNVRWGLWGGVSSYRVWNDCDMSELFTGKSYGGTSSGWYYGDRSYVGDTYNDSFGSLWIKKAP